MLEDSRPTTRPRPESQEAAGGLVWDAEEGRWRGEEEEGEAASQRTLISASNGIQKQEKECIEWIDWSSPNDPGNPFMVSRSRYSLLQLKRG